MRKVGPSVLPRDTPRYLYETIRRLEIGNSSNQTILSAVLRGENDAGGPLVDLSGLFNLGGRTLDQVAHGSTRAGGNLTLSSTISNTKGFIYLGTIPNTRIAYDETNNRLGIGTDTPLVRLHQKHTVKETMQRWEGPGSNITSCVSNGTTTVTNVAGAFGNAGVSLVRAGMVVTGTLVPVGTTVVTWTDSNTIILSQSVPAGTTTMTFADKLDLILDDSTNELFFQGSTAINFKFLTGGIAPTTGTALRITTSSDAIAGLPRTFIQSGPTNNNLALTGHNAATGNSFRCLYNFSTINTWGGVGVALTNVARLGINIDPSDFSGSIADNQPDSLHVARRTGATAGVPTLLVEAGSSTEMAIAVRTASTGTSPNKVIGTKNLGGFRHNGDLILTNAGTLRGLMNGLSGGTTECFAIRTSGDGLVVLVGNRQTGWSDTLVSNTAFIMGDLLTTHRSVFFSSTGSNIFTRFGISTQYMLISNGQAGGANFPAPDGSGSPSTLRVYNAATGGFDAAIICKVETARAGQTGDFIRCVTSSAATPFTVGATGTTTVTPSTDSAALAVRTTNQTLGSLTSTAISVFNPSGLEVMSFRNSGRFQLGQSDITLDGIVRLSLNTTPTQSVNLIQCTDGTDTLFSVSARGSFVMGANSAGMDAVIRCQINFSTTQSAIVMSVAKAAVTIWRIQSNGNMLVGGSSTAAANVGFEKATFQVGSTETQNICRFTSGLTGATDLTINLRAVVSTGRIKTAVLFTDDNATVANSKLLALSVASITVGQTRTWTSQDRDGTVAYINDTMTAAYVAKTANYTLTTTDAIVNCTANTFTITLPTAVGATGQMYIIKNSGAGVVTVATTSSQTIDTVATQTVARGNSMTVASDGANWIIV